MKRIFVFTTLALFLASCGSASSSSDTSSVANKQMATTVPDANTFEYTITVGENTGTDVVIDVVQGVQVVLNVVNPNGHDDVHLHGYDLSTGSIEKGETGTMTFQAIKTGDFDIESHESEELISILRVTAP
jgi:hypothetical protein